MTDSVDDIQVQKAYEEALDDVHTRFLLNLPPEELATSDRILFQLEQAFWFYDDFICDNSPLPLPRFKSLKPFALKIFQMSPLLEEENFYKMWEEFSMYKQKISTYGTILMNSACTKVILCQAWKGNSWTFPAGKVNQHELGTDAGARETYEETGFDPNCNFGLAAKMKEHSQITWQPLQEEDALVFLDSGKRRTMYVCKGVPEDFPFEPVARKEVSKVSWHPIDDLPKKSYCVIPFMKQLRRWIRQSNKKRGKHSTPKRRSSSSKKPRSRNNSRGRVREDDALLETGLATAGDVDGWSEEDMFKANEALLGRKITYDGNPHLFAEKGFDGRDPHQFKVVGGSYMNSVKGLAPPPDQSRLQPLFRKETNDEDEVGELTPFFSDGGVTPWGEQVSEAAGMSPPRVNTGAGEAVVARTTQRPEPQKVSSDPIFMTDVEITAKSQSEKTQNRQTPPISMKEILAKRQASQKQYDENQRFIENWTKSLPNPPPTERFGEIKFDKDRILEAMNKSLYGNVL